jgi:hypothetical protein
MMWLDVVIDPLAVRGRSLLPRAHRLLSRRGRLLRGAGGAFGVGMTVGMGQFPLAGAGILLHALVFLVLWTGRADARARSAKTAFTYERIS